MEKNKGKSKREIDKKSADNESLPTEAQIVSFLKRCANGDGDTSSPENECLRRHSEVYVQSIMACVYSLFRDNTKSNTTEVLQSLFEYDHFGLFKYLRALEYYRYGVIPCSGIALSLCPPSVSSGGLVVFKYHHGFGKLENCGLLFIPSDAMGNGSVKSFTKGIVSECRKTIKNLRDTLKKVSFG